MTEWPTRRRLAASSSYDCRASAVDGASSTISGSTSSFIGVDGTCQTPCILNISQRVDRPDRSVRVPCPPRALAIVLSRAGEKGSYKDNPDMPQAGDERGATSR
jgi:hypothetical protein